MIRDEYLNNVRELYENGLINEEAYNALVDNQEVISKVFCEDDCPYNYGLPKTYAEIQYDDFDNAEAIDGAKFDDINYLRYTER